MKDPRLKNLTDDQICALRLRCVEPFIACASKLSMDKGEVFALAEKSWDFMLEALGEKGQADTQAPA